MLLCSACDGSGMSRYNLNHSCRDCGGNGEDREEVVEIDSFQLAKSLGLIMAAMQKKGSV